MANIQNIREITGDTVIQTSVANQASPGWRQVSIAYNGGTNVSTPRFTKSFGNVDPTSSLVVGEEAIVQYRINGSVTNRNRGVAFQAFVRLTGIVRQNDVDGTNTRTIRIEFANTNLSTLQSDPTLNNGNLTLSAGNRDINAVTIGGVGFGEVDSSVRWDFNAGLRLPNIGGGAGPIGVGADGTVQRIAPSGQSFSTAGGTVSPTFPVVFQELNNDITGTVNLQSLVNDRNVITDALDTRITNVSFTSINETPSSLGTAGQELRVNTAEDALEFYTPVVDTDDNYYFEGQDFTGTIGGSSSTGQTITLQTNPLSDDIPSSWRVGSIGNIRAGGAYQNFRVTGFGGLGTDPRNSMTVLMLTGSNATIGAPALFDVNYGHFDSDTVLTLSPNNTGETTSDSDVEVDIAVTANGVNNFLLSASADITGVRGDRFYDPAASFRIPQLIVALPTTQQIQLSAHKDEYDWSVGQWGYATAEGARDVEIVFQVTGLPGGNVLDTTITKITDRTGSGSNPGTWRVYPGTPNETRFIDTNTSLDGSVVGIDWTDNADGTISATANAANIVNLISASTTSAAVEVFEESTRISTLLNTLRFIGAGVTASETDPGDITVAIPESGDFYNHRLNSTVNLQALTLPTSVDFSIIPEGSDWVAGDKGYARSSDGLDEFRFTVNTISRAGSGLFRVDVDTITLASGSTRTSWDVDAGPIETRFELAGDTTNTRGVVFNRDTSGAVTGSVNVAGLGGGGTGGVVWPFQSGFGNTSPERITFNQNEWQPGDEPTLTLTGVANTGWAEEQYGQLVGTTRNGNTTTIQAIINFRVRSVTLSGSDTVIGVEVVDNLLFTQASLFMNWGIYPGLASFDAASSGSAYTDLDTKFWRTANLTGSEAFQEDTATNLFGRTSADSSASPPVVAAAGQSIHFSDVESNLQWVPGQFGYTRHSTGNALFTFEVQAYDSDTNRMAVEIVDIIRNTLGQFANRTSTIDSMNLNRWAIFAGSPTPEVVLGTDDAFPIEIYGDLDSTVEVENVEATSVATRIVFDEDDFELHIGAEAAGAAVTYQAITAPAAGGFGPQVVTDIYSGSVNAVQTGGFLNIQLGLQGAGLAVGGTANVGNLDRTQSVPAINNASGLIIAFNRRDLDNTLTEDDFVEIVTVRNDTDSNGNRARVRTDLVDAAVFSAADYFALGTNVPLYFRSTGGSTTPDPNQIIVRSKGQQVDPLILQGRDSDDANNVGAPINDAIQLNVVAPLAVTSSSTTATLALDYSTDRVTSNRDLQNNSVNTLDGTFTGTLPRTPEDGDFVVVKNVGTADAFVSSLGGGHDIDGEAAAITLCSLDSRTFTFASGGVDGTAGWVTSSGFTIPRYPTNRITNNLVAETGHVTTVENSVTVMLPVSNSVVDGDFVIIKNISAGVRLINPNGSTIDGVAGNLSLSSVLGSITLTWSNGGIDGTAGWITTSSHEPSVPRIVRISLPTATADAAGNFVYQINHNLGLGTELPIVQVYEGTEQVLPMSLIANTGNQITITFPVAVTGTAVVMG